MSARFARFSRNFLFDFENGRHFTPISPVRDTVKRFFIGSTPDGLPSVTATPGLPILRPFFCKTSPRPAPGKTDSAADLPTICYPVGTVVRSSLYTSTSNFLGTEKANKTRMCLEVDRYPSSSFFMMLLTEEPHWASRGQTRSTSERLLICRVSLERRITWQIREQ
jgi:hypothetical protein